jgi:hypothetical protein
MLANTCARQEHRQHFEFAERNLVDEPGIKMDCAHVPPREKTTGAQFLGPREYYDKYRGGDTCSHTSLPLPPPGEQLSPRARRIAGGPEGGGAGNSGARRPQFRLGTDDTRSGSADISQSARG